MIGPVDLKDVARRSAHLRHIRPDDIDAATMCAMATEIERLRDRNSALVAALRPFAGCVFNDNGDLTVTDTYTLPHDVYIAAYFALKGTTP